MMKPKRCKKRRRSSLNIPRDAIRSTMVSSSIYCVDTRNNSWIPTLIQRWSILLHMLSPMGGWTLKMIRICSIGWSTRSVYLRWSLKIKYITSWLGTCKVRKRILVAILVSWKNHGLNKLWRWFSLFFAPINCIVVATSQRRFRNNYPSN